MPTPDYVNVRTEHNDGIMTITLDRPGGRNAFNTQFYAELRSAIREADVDPDVDGVIIDSASQNFAVGGDLKEMVGYLDGDEPSWDLWKFTRQPAVRVDPQPAGCRPSRWLTGSAAVAVSLPPSRATSSLPLPYFPLRNPGDQGRTHGRPGRACSLWPRYHFP